MDRLKCNSLPDVTYFASCQVVSDKMRQFFQVRVILFCNSGPAGQMRNCDWAREVSFWIVSSFILCSSFFQALCVLLRRFAHCRPTRLKKPSRLWCARLWLILAFGEYDFVPRLCEVLLRFQARTNAFNNARQAVHFSME